MEWKARQPGFRSLDESGQHYMCNVGQYYATLGCEGLIYLQRFSSIEVYRTRCSIPPFRAQDMKGMKAQFIDVQKYVPTL